MVHPGDETSGTHSRSMLTEYLEFVSSVKKPRLVRGDVSFGNESVIGDCEAADVRYLFKTKRSKSVRRAFRELLADPGAWLASSGGWQCAEREVRLDSWEKARRMVFARQPAEKMPKRRKNPPQRKFRQLEIPGLELVEAPDEDYADGYEWYALVTDLDMDARDVLPLYRERGDCENIFDEMKNQWGWSGFTAHSQGIVTIYTATNEKARRTYRAISAFLAKVASASQLSLEERRQRIIAHAFREYGTIRRLFPPDIGGQMTMPLA